MADIHLDYDRIEEVGNTMRTKANTAKDDATDLKHRVDELLSDGLELKKSSPALQQSYNDFTTSLQKAIDGITNFANQFDNIQSSADAMDQEIYKNVTSKGD